MFYTLFKLSGIEKKRKEIEGRTLREESEQYYFLYKLNLLRSTYVEPDTHLFLNTNLILPYRRRDRRSLSSPSSEGSRRSLDRSYQHRSRTPPSESYSASSR